MSRGEELLKKLGKWNIPEFKPVQTYYTTEYTGATLNIDNLNRAFEQMQKQMDESWSMTTFPQWKTVENARILESKFMETVGLSNLLQKLGEDSRTCYAKHRKICTCPIFFRDDQGLNFLRGNQDMVGVGKGIPAKEDLYMDHRRLVHHGYYKGRPVYVAEN